MIYAQKEVTRYLTIENGSEYIHITMLKMEVNDINEKVLMEFYESELIDNESEENYINYGISTDFNGELLIIDVKRFIRGLENWIEKEKEEEELDDVSIYIDVVKELIINLQKYVDYDLYFEEEKK